MAVVLTLEQKIAQKIMIGFRGLSLDERSTIYADIVERGIGGVVLYNVDVPTNSRLRNIQSPEQLLHLTSQLQTSAALPLLIAVDQEGGRVARLSPEHGFPDTVSHQWLGKQACLSLTREKSSRLAETLAQCGINLNFAPCVDLNVNPQNPIISLKERSFSRDPDIVVNHAMEYVKAHHAFGVRCALKHFPGHGSSKGDSHLGFVDITRSWSPDELIPYKKLVEGGLADAIMTAHVVNGTWDKNVPATLSFRAITEKLRRELNYTGLVFTDDLQMRAITDRYGLPQAIEKAVLAGADILLFGNNCDFDEEIADKAIRILKKLVEDGIVPQERIDESVQRITHLKSRL
ncbi:glycoside hydrolase family 3 [candidate division KSB1 bacterium]|nr:glycoside hydrolase family 3 protein [candidate division KSB1 bacterium]RQW00895.1 MAG: glycoside hydrolase family 3 [candidate division KSB1 bacterium]